LGFGDWGLGIGDWAQSPIPNPQSPIPNPQSPIVYFIFIYLSLNIIVKNKKLLKVLIKDIDFNLLQLIYNFLILYKFFVPKSFSKANLSI